MAPWQFFRKSEFACKHCGENRMDKGFVDRLDTLRAVYGKPLVVSSGYRCPTHNMAVSSTGPDGPHTTGRAVDLRVRGADAYQLLQLALHAGFSGVGIQQKGASRFLHLDDLPNSPTRPRPTVWSY
jgi:zinc D-Ala-D-Ala carboxypeptidase